MGVHREQISSTSKPAAFCSFPGGSCLLIIERGRGLARDRQVKGHPCR